MTTQTSKCTSGKWEIDFDNIGHCSKYKSGICLLSGEICPEKGVRDYNKIQVGMFNEYGQLIRTAVKIANKDKVGLLPYGVQDAINDLIYRKHGG